MRVRRERNEDVARRHGDGVSIDEDEPETALRVVMHDRAVALEGPGVDAVRERDGRDVDGDEREGGFDDDGDFFGVGVDGFDLVVRRRRRRVVVVVVVVVVLLHFPPLRRLLLIFLLRKRERRAVP